jgi:hypothetical protein
MPVRGFNKEIMQIGCWLMMCAAHTAALLHMLTHRDLLFIQLDTLCQHSAHFCCGEGIDCIITSKTERAA